LKPKERARQQPEKVSNGLHASPGRTPLNPKEQPRQGPEGWQGANPNPPAIHPCAAEHLYAVQLRTEPAQEGWHLPLPAAKVLSALTPPAEPAWEEWHHSLSGTGRL